MEEITTEVNQTNIVDDSNKSVSLKSEAASHAGKWIQVLVLLVLVSILVTAFLMAKDGLDTRMSIVKSENSMCDTAYCLKASAVYKNGVLSWDAIKGLPAFGFAISTSKVYSENQDVELVCPISYDGTQNQLLAKSMFILSGQGIGKCK